MPKTTFERLHDAILALGKEPGETMFHETALRAARLKLTEIQAACLMKDEGLLKGMPPELDQRSE